MTPELLQAIQGLMTSADELAERVYANKKLMKLKGYDGTREDFEHEVLIRTKGLRKMLESA